MTTRRLNPISDRKKKRDAIYRPIVRQWWRELCAKAPDGIPRCRWPGCTRPAAKQPHHKHGRIGALLWEIRLFIELCWFHHEPIHRDAEAAAIARKHGLLCEKGWFNRNPFSEHRTNVTAGLPL